MDFSYSAEQQAIRDLVAKMFAERVSHDRIRQLESADWFDSELWAELAKANVPGLALPESVGGSGFGILESCLVLEEVGRHLAHVPLFATLVLGGPAIAAFGDEAQRQRWLPGVANGDAVLSAALEEAGGSDPARPRTTAERDGEGWRLDGVKECTPAAHLASCILVPARTGDGSVGVFLLDPTGPGVTIERQITTNHEPHGRLILDSALLPEDALLGGPERGAEITSWIVERAQLGLAAMQLGVGDEALRRTAEYVIQRKQFERSIATFQAVALRTADAYIDLDAMRSTLMHAVWRVSENLPAREEVAAAKWWACRGGQRIAYAAQHLHGGISADIDYPIHRFLLWAKQIEGSLGGASQQLAQLGAWLAENPRLEN